LDPLSERIDALFDEHAPEPDPTGSLADIAQAWSALEPKRLAIVAESGRVLAAWGDGATPSAGDTAVRVPLERADGVWTISAAFAREPAAAERDAFFAACRNALRAFAADCEVREHRRRVVHLSNERDALTESHNRNLGELIEAREEQAQAQRDYVENLENEVERRSAALRVALRDAELANEAKTAFLANMSHEIRTPMTAILGYTDLISDPEITRTELHEYAQVIRSNGEHLLQMLNDILDLSKIEARKVVPDFMSFDVRRLLEDVVSLLKVRATDKGLFLVSECDAGVPLEIISDPTRVRQILLNLVGNALKFTQQGGVTISTRFDSRGGRDWILFDVADTGIGLTETELQRLFQPFTQADASTTRRFGGTGLGLSISRNLARILGGDVTVASSVGRGSTFRAAVQLERAAS